MTRFSPKKKSSPIYLGPKNLATFWCTGWAWNCQIIFRCASIHGRAGFILFGMWLYLDELQFMFEFHSGRMIFCWVMALELVFFVQILSCPDFFFYVLWDIDLIFGMSLYLEELQFMFEFRSGRMIFCWVMALEIVF